MSVTVVTTAYGRRAHEFFPRWWEAIQQLNPAPDRVIVASDGSAPLFGPDVIRGNGCPWKHQQAWYQNVAIEAADTDWIWLVDIDDIAKPDALNGLDDVEADVWLMGFETSEGETYVPAVMSNTEYREQWTNPYAGASPFRRDAFVAAGWFDDIAFQDWGLWRRLAENGARFEASGRTHFHYMRHPHSRTETELTKDRRAANIAEMLGKERQLAA